MIAAKTVAGFPEIRGQFKSEHSIEKGGTEKYYLALVHGHAKLPTEHLSLSHKHWNHGPEENPKADPRGRIEITTVWGSRGKAVCYDKGGNETEDAKAAGTAPLWALTLYEPIAWFKNKNTGEDFTLLQLQIITGRRHQIRFHCAEIGHVLAGDTKYDDKCWNDRTWCPRVFLHSYCTKFREPFTERWFEATSPLPQDLGEILENNFMLVGVKKPWTGPRLLSRRQHPGFGEMMNQYDPKKPLLFSKDPPKAVIESAMAAIAAKRGTVVSSAKKKRRIMVPPQFKDRQPVTPPLPQQQQRQQQQQQQPAPAPAFQQTTRPAAAAPAPAPAAHGWKRMESRSQPGIFYYFNNLTGANEAEPPAPWELKTSRSNANIVYYWNTQTGETSPGKPEV